MVMNSLMVVLLGPLAHMSKVRCDGALCWGYVVEVDIGVAWGHLGCPQVIQIVEHRVVIDVAVSVFTFDPAYQVAVNKIEAQEGGVIFTYLVD
jgi:hypothetical protein